MLSATALAVFLVPVFFVAVLRLFKVQPRRVAEEAELGEGAQPAGGK